MCAYERRQCLAGRYYGGRCHRSEQPQHIRHQQELCLEIREQSLLHPAESPLPPCELSMCGAGQAQNHMATLEQLAQGHHLTHFDTTVPHLPVEQDLPANRQLLEKVPASLKCSVMYVMQTKYSCTTLCGMHIIERE